MYQEICRAQQLASTKLYVGQKYRVIRRNICMWWVALNGIIMVKYSLHICPDYCHTVLQRFTNAPVGSSTWDLHTGIKMKLCMCAWTCVCTARTCVRACVCVCVRACVLVCMHMLMYEMIRRMSVHWKVCLLCMCVLASGGASGRFSCHEESLSLSIQAYWVRSMSAEV